MRRGNLAVWHHTAIILVTNIILFRGLETFDESKYNDSLALTEEEQMAEKEKKVSISYNPPTPTQHNKL